jgi:hypothetical protein
VIKQVAGWVGLVAACGLFWGCGSSDSESSTLSQDQLPSALASAICDSFGACCTAGKFVFDETNCRASETALLKPEYKPSSSAATYDAHAASDCLSQLKNSLTCGAINQTATLEACARVFVGTLAVGQTCTPCNAARLSCADDCKAPGFCAYDSASGTNYCKSESAAPSHGKLGDSCTVSCGDAQCYGGPIVSFDPTPTTNEVACYKEDGLYCSGMCRKLSAIGEDCAYADQCESGLFCDRNVDRCAAPHPSGASCIADEQCQSDYCSNAGICSNRSVTTQQCANGTP